jgi:hypothetical protein
MGERVGTSLGGGENNSLQLVLVQEIKKLAATLIRLAHNDSLRHLHKRSSQILATG